MNSVDLPQREVLKIINSALDEDLGGGDITTNSVIDPSLEIRGVILCKENGVIAGLNVAELVFKTIDPELAFSRFVDEGSQVRKGTELALVSGSASSILSGERLALNFLQHLSGIATKTARYQKMVEDFPVRLTDTRKTTPGLRILEKYAVRMGGGSNHRFGLYDAVLIKDNHIRASGGLKETVEKARKRIPHTVKIEVEVGNLEEVRRALSLEVDILLLDNMQPDLLARAVEIVNGRVLLEASGGITAQNLVEVAKTGVDIISLGSLTHSVQAVDISLDFKPN